MKIRRIGVLLIVGSFVFALVAVSCAASAQVGKKGFEKHCAICHPEGGNIINPGKPLKKSVLAANGIITEKDIVKIIRHPGSGMTSFGTDVLSDSEAREIAHYILKTFN